MQRPKPTIGAILFCRQVDHRQREEPPLEEVTVTKVGRVYFTCKGATNYERAFHLSDWRQQTDYTPDRELYATRQEYLDDVEAQRLYLELKRHLERTQYRQVSLDALRAAHLALVPKPA